MIFAYWNSHQCLYSLRDTKTRRVFARSSSLCLYNVEFKVSESGRQRVLRTKQKNVHAGIQGEHFNVPVDLPPMWVEVKYNPYAGPNFIRCDNGEPVLRATIAHLRTTFKSRPFVSVSADLDGNVY